MMKKKQLIQKALELTDKLEEIKKENEYLKEQLEDFRKTNSNGCKKNGSCHMCAWSKSRDVFADGVFYHEALCIKEVEVCENFVPKFCKEKMSDAGGLSQYTTEMV